MFFPRTRRFLIVTLATGLLPLGALHASNHAFNAAKKSTQKLLKPGKAHEIEALAAKYKAQPYTIIDRWPAIYGFHDTFSLKGVKDDHQWQQRRQLLESWVEAYPQSCSAKTALADWWVGYAWKARGTGRASTVTPGGWTLMYERLDKAVEVLEAVAPKTIDDPEYFRVLLTALRGKGREAGEKAQVCFERGVAFSKEYYPLYQSHVYFLLPRWYGEKGESEQVAGELAERFPPEKGDILYAHLIYRRASFDKDTEFKEWTVAYERVKRGYLRLIEDHPPRYHSHARSELCFLASLQGDHPTAKKLSLESDRLRTSAFGDWETFLTMRKASGAQAAIDEARKAEQEGRLEEAETLYRSFTPDPATNHWLEVFYLCHGMKEKLHATRSERRFDVDVAKANANTWASLALFGPLVHEWEITRDAAQRFDAVRPFNLSGRAALLLYAAREGDREAAETLRRAIVEYKSKRPAYQIAQSVLSGEKTWEEVAPSLMNSDGLSQHAGLTIAAYYLTQENYAGARTVMEAMFASTRNNSSFAAVFGSFLHGSLASMLKDGGKEPVKSDTATDNTTGL